MRRVAPGEGRVVRHASNRSWPLSCEPVPHNAGNKKGHVVLLHDLTFVDARARQARMYVTLALAGVAAGLGLLAIAIMLGFLRGWQRSIKTQIEEARLGSSLLTHRGEDTFFNREIQSLLSEFNVERRYADGIKVEWSPSTLRKLLEEELTGTQVLVVSNREPYIHNRRYGEIELQIPASGLVAAVEPVMRACGGTWIAHGSGSADRETVDSNDRVQVPPNAPVLHAAPAVAQRGRAGRVITTASPMKGFGLVPHRLRQTHFSRRRLAAICGCESNASPTPSSRKRLEDDPIVLVQDYHFALLPRMIATRLPVATIVVFWHIPWPNPKFSAFVPGARKSSTAC